MYIGVVESYLNTERFSMSAVAKLNKYLISTRSQVSTDKFPYLPNEKYVALALVKKDHNINRTDADAFTKRTLHGHPDEILKKKEPIELEEILEPPEGQQNVKLVFIEGAPGVGKSTLALELCRRQKEIKAMEKYSLVLLFQLRDKDVQAIQEVKHLFHHDNTSLQQSVTEEVIDRDGKGVLFILDGFDELPSNLRKESDSFFVKLIQGKHLPACTVLVTSRPSASGCILPSIKHYKYIEILGFTENQIEQYATSMFNNDSELEDFRKYISINQVIRSMMYVPLNSAIVLHIYQKYRIEDKTIPHTMTQLYTELCTILIKKYLTEKEDPLADELNTTSLIGLPPKIKDQLLMLGNLAYIGALSEEITFEQLPSGCDDLGLLNISTGFYLGRKCYSFLHLTLQEFLAGYYFSQLSPVEQKLSFTSSGTKHHLDVMWRFVAGLNGFKNIGWSVVYDASKQNYSYRKNLTCGPFIVRCLFEVQDVKEIQIACGNIFSQPQYPEFRLTKHLDCYAAGYCVAVSGDIKWKLDLCYNRGYDVLDMLCCGLRSAAAITHNAGGKGIGGSILGLNLAGNILTVAAINRLSELQTTLQHIQLLNLGDNNFNKNEFDSLADIVTIMSKLTCLKVGNNPEYGNPVDEGGMVKFFQSLSCHKSLNELVLTSVNLDLTSIKALSDMMISIDCLTKLEIGHRRMSNECVSEIVKALLSPTSLKKITFHGISWTRRSVQNFKLLKKNHNISSLTFVRDYDYDFHLDPIIPVIAEALHVNKSLKVLKVPPYYHNSDDLEEDVHVSHESVTALSMMLKVNTTLKRLDIFAPLTCDDVSFLSSALRFNYTLEKLNIGNKRIRVLHYSDSESESDEET